MALLTENRKRCLFWLILIALPLLFLATLEGVLRAFDYGGDLSLVLTKQAGDQKYYQINRHVAKRYFPGDEVAVPDARSEVFEYKKSPKTFRIFCLGESTTAGWPFQFNATFPSLLQDRLSNLFPERNFEVINVGISAISSYSVLDFTRELVHYQPDLFLIYLGHNEFYGALGVASTQKLGESRNYIKFYLRLQKLRTFCLLRDGILELRHLLRAGESPSQPATLMERMAGDKVVPYHSPKYEIAKRSFAENLAEILDIIRSSDTPVLAGTLVSNLRDQEPFQSVFSEHFGKQKEWDHHFSEGLALEKAGDFSGAMGAYLQAQMLDSLPAKLFFRLGKCYEGLTQYDRALSAYQRARDLDALRFRASEEFNQIIRQVCAERHVPVVEIEKAFMAESQHGLIGNNLIIEHLHPNFEGYYLMADAYCRGMAENGIPVASDKWQWERDKSKEENLRLAYVTDLDLEIANRRIKALTSRWPFMEVKTVRSSSEEEWNAELEKTVRAIERHELSWNSAHYRIADYLVQRGRYAEAEREYYAVIKVIPSDYYPYIFLGNVLVAQKKIAEAERVYQQALVLSRDLPFAYAKLGMVCLAQNNPDKAKPLLERAISLSVKAQDFKSQDVANARYLLSLAYAQTNDLAGAKKEAELALELLPDDPRIRSLLQQLTAALRPS